MNNAIEEAAFEVLTSIVEKEFTQMQNNISILSPDIVLNKLEYLSGMARYFNALFPGNEREVLNEWEWITERFLNLAEIVRKTQG